MKTETVTITLNEVEQELLQFLRDYPDDSLDFALERFKKTGLYSHELIGRWLYLLQRAGFVVLDINASRSRLWLAEEMKQDESH